MDNDTTPTEHATLAEIEALYEAARASTLRAFEEEWVRREELFATLRALKAGR